MQGPQLVMSWLSSLVPISLPNHQGFTEQWLAGLEQKTIVEGNNTDESY